MTFVRTFMSISLVAAATVIATAPASAEPAKRQVVAHCAFPAANKDGFVIGFQQPETLMLNLTERYDTADKKSYKRRVPVLTPVGTAPVAEIMAMSSNDRLLPYQDMHFPNEPSWYKVKLPQGGTYKVTFVSGEMPGTGMSLQVCVLNKDYKPM